MQSLFFAPLFLYANEAKDHVNILVLSYYNYNYSWHKNVVSSIKAYLEKENISATLFEESIDYRANLDISHHELNNLHAKHYREKYKKNHFDVIITIETQNFIIDYRDTLFPNIPVLFCRLTNDYKHVLSKVVNSTATVDERSAQKILDIAIANHKNIKNVIVIQDESSTSIEAVKEIKSKKSSYPNHSFYYIQPVNDAEFIEQMQLLPQDAFILETSHFSSPRLETTSNKEYTQSISYEYAYTPVYTVWDQAIGNGAIAGQDTHASEHGKALGEMLVQIINQGSAVDVKAEIIPTRTVIIDYEKFIKFSLNERNFPTGNYIFINKSPSFYEKHKPVLQIATLVFFILFLLLCIVSLLLIKQALKKQILIKEMQALEKEKALNKEMLTRSKMQSLVTFSRGIAHDLSTLLHSVMACSQLAKSSARGNTQVVEDINHAISATESCLNLLDSMASAQKKKLEHIDIIEELYTVTMLLAKQLPENITLQVVKTDFLEQEPFMVFASHEHILRIFQNLINNACQSIGVKGSIIIRLCKKNENSINIFIEDTGKGISQDVRDNIFDPYYTTRKTEGGSGLGLFIVHRLLSACNASIILAKSDKNGTIFCLNFPRAN